MVDGRPLALLFVTSENFEKQMHYLKDKKYKVIALDELVEGIKRGKKFELLSVEATLQRFSHK